MKKKLIKTTSAKSGKPANGGTPQFVFGKENFRLMFIGLGVIALGFLLMSGSENIYDTRKMVIAPIVVLTGFVIEIFAIMLKPKKKETVE